MVFASLIFLCVFMPLFFIVYNLQKDKKYKNTVLFLFSLIFYAWGEPVYVLLMLFSVIANYYIALCINRNREIINCDVRKYRYAEIKFAKKCLKAIFALGIIFNLSLLGIFKYSGFFVEIINSIFNFTLRVPNISLPIGISFFTFQILSYIVDVYYERVNVQKNFIYLGAYVSAFPQLIAGPIVRYQDIENELENRNENKILAAEGIRRFIIGLSKKVLIANTLAQVVSLLETYSNVQYKMTGAIIIIVAYTLQIYYDFSGYSDMAIGLGKMMGFNYNENFNYPYIASSVTDFWRRWHISLSSFFRDYVYIPLGGNRVKPYKHIINIFVVWFLTGMWHGASWNFIIWGLYYAIFLIIEKYLPKAITSAVPKILKHMFTMLIVMNGWIIFKFENGSEYAEFMKTLLGNYGLGNYKFFKHVGIDQAFYIMTLAIAIMFAFPIIKNLVEKYKSSNIFKICYDVVLLIMFFLSIASLAAGSYNPFIYFKF